MIVEILGMGCTKCQTLEEMVREIVEDLNLDVEITKVSDINKIVEYGVMLTPALVIDGKVRVTGRLPSRDEVEGMLKEGGV